MPLLDNFSVTQFPIDSTYLEVNGERYPITSFGSDWALNEIPQAYCTLAVGINGKTGQLADIHSMQPWTQMVPAKVISAPFSPTRFAAKSWGGQPITLFDGKITTVNLKKVQGKLQLRVGLVHWLYGLSCSSMLSSETHPGNAASLTAAAVIGSAASNGLNLSSYVSSSVYSNTIRNFERIVANDLWSGIKTLFTFFASNSTGSMFRTNCNSATLQSNGSALDALSRIEGILPAEAVKQIKALPGGKDTSLPYQYGQVLNFTKQGLGEELSRQVADGIAMESVVGLAGVSFWDKLITQYCPMFGLAVVPMIDRALVVADTPILSKFNGNGDPDVWETHYAEDDDSTESNGELVRPLRGVMVLAPVDNRVLQFGNTPKALPGGCLFSDEIAPGDGTVLPIGPPSWFFPSPRGGQQVLGFSGLVTNPAMQPFYSAWAQDVFSKNTLRGKLQTVTGKLRLDIAPGSIIRVVNTSDARLVKRYAIDDHLAMDCFGSVARMSLYINAEAPAAGCAYQLSYTRTLPEYKDKKRTSIAAHPFFGTAIHGDGKHGAPLITGAETDAFYAQA